MKRKLKQPDYEGQILALGWNTESKGGSGPELMRAFKGSDLNPVQSSPWLLSWKDVLDWIKLCSEACLRLANAAQIGGAS